mmetsp:Transcript_37154/g.93246  ORF Transcript_37154/g.93246 Transcript_37154/m.93246 type:complete len:100 (-) Transcript_37154:1946-2245(-)
MTCLLRVMGFPLDASISVADIPTECMTHKSCLSGCLAVGLSVCLTRLWNEAGNERHEKARQAIVIRCDRAMASRAAAHAHGHVVSACWLQLTSCCCSCA